MKRMTALFIAITWLSPAAFGGEFYYGTFGRVPLTVDSTKAVLKLDASIAAADQEAVLFSVKRIAGRLSGQPTTDGFVAVELSKGGGYYRFLDSVVSVNGITRAEPYYVWGGSEPFLPGETFCVGFDLKITRSQVDSINNLYGVAVVAKEEGAANVYILKNSSRSAHRLLELANHYSDSVPCRYAYPLFMLRVVKDAYRVYDYYSALQSHTRQVIGWLGDSSVYDFAGLADSVVVAVIDDGITSHPDLPGSRILPGWDFNASLDSLMEDDDPTPGDTVAHGMACAGIIAASHCVNASCSTQPASGVIGLNPTARILPVKMFDSRGTSFWLNWLSYNHSMRYAWTHGADVISCSWSFAVREAMPKYLAENIDSAFRYGRGGKGTPVVFSSGNYAGFGWPYINPTACPACVEQALAVGAVNLNGQRQSYSQYGTELDVVAPSAGINFGGDVWTLDQVGNHGYNPYGKDAWGNPIDWNCVDSQSQSNDQDMDCRFGGTSAAAPVVAGVASLLLSRNDTLTAETVYEIIRRSAVPLAATIPDTLTGWGRVDAFRAVLSVARGDANNDAFIDVSDITSLIDYLYISFVPPFPSELLGDCDCDGMVDIADLSLLIDYLYLQLGSGPIIPCFKFSYP